MNQPSQEILDASAERKAKTLDHIVHHLVDVIEKDPRPREKTRAKIALTNISKWIKVCETK